MLERQTYVTHNLHALRLMNQSLLFLLGQKEKRQVTHSYLNPIESVASCAVQDASLISDP